MRAPLSGSSSTEHNERRGRTAFVTAKTSRTHVKDYQMGNFGRKNNYFNPEQEYRFIYGHIG